MRVLTRTDVQNLIAIPEVIDLMRDVFCEVGRGAVNMPQRAVLRLHNGLDSVLFMPGHVRNGDRVGIKIVSVFPGNQTRSNVPTINATILLSDPETGELMSVMDGTYITALRTGAVSALATDLLARQDAHRLGMFGAGVQARTQIDAIMTVRPITSVRIYDSKPGSAARLVTELRASHGAMCSFEAAASADEAARGVDIIVTATTSRVPVFDGLQVDPGTHINSIGSFTPDVRELDDETIRRARIFVDSSAEALAEAGDLIIPLQAGVIKRSDIEADLGELVLGHKHGRRQVDEITIFKSVGLAVEDIVVAARVHEKAEATHVGALIS